jgi:hypothetical protein
MIGQDRTINFSSDRSAKDRQKKPFEHTKVGCSVEFKGVWSIRAQANVPRHVIPVDGARTSRSVFLNEKLGTIREV